MYRDITLLVTDELTNEVRHALLAGVESVGGHVYLVYRPNVVVARIPGAVHDVVEKFPGVRLVTSRPIDAAHYGVSDQNAETGVRFFNWVVSGAAAEDIDRVKDIQVDVTTLNEHLAFQQPTGFRVGAESFRAAEPQHHTIYPNDVMDGYTEVSVFFVESVDDPTTTANENEFTWTVQHHNDTANRISSGFWWWINVASARGIYLTYGMGFRPGSDWQQQVPFEPIRANAGLGFSGDQRWVFPILANYGITTGVDARERTRNYGAYLRATYGAKNAFAVFAIYNPPPVAPDRHLNSIAAYAWYGDYVHILYKNGSYPVEQTAWVFAHEMGHVFWACDEYQANCAAYEPQCSNCYGPGTVGGPGPRNASMNWNCEICTPNGPAACIMHDPSYSNWVNHSTCLHTRNMIGW